MEKAIYGIRQGEGVQDRRFCAAKCRAIGRQNDLDLTRLSEFGPHGEGQGVRSQRRGAEAGGVTFIHRLRVILSGGRSP